VLAIIVGPIASLNNSMSWKGHVRVLRGVGGPTDRNVPGLAQKLQHY
jgi:hypothetical protein